MILADIFKKINFNSVPRFKNLSLLIITLAALLVGVYNIYLIKISGNNPDKILKEIPADPPSIGNPDAKITMIEFGDFQCPYCNKFHKEVYPQLKKQYIDTGKVRFIYLNFAFLGRESKDAAEASLCAREQGKFWEYHDALFENQDGENVGAFYPEKLKKIASGIDLDLPAFANCIAGNRYDKLINDEKNLGQKYGVNGTPEFFIGSQAIQGTLPISNYQKAIDVQLVR